MRIERQLGDVVTGSPERIVADEIGGGDERAIALGAAATRLRRRAGGPARSAQRAAPNAFYDSEGGRMSITLAKSKRHCPAVAALRVGNEYGGRQSG